MNSHDTTLAKADSEEGSRTPLVSLRGITKRFSNVVANDAVDLDLFPGEVHALLGENGAGKSTLMKVLYGFYRSDGGTIRLDGQEIQIGSPLDARRYQIGMVFQTFTLIPAMTVVENIALYLPELPAIIQTDDIARRVNDLGSQYGLQVNPHLPVRDVPIGDQQKVEVLKLLVGNARVLIFDEATRVLAPHEIEGLFSIFTRLKQAGYAIVFITHKMREVLACADRITVMRRGRVTGTIPATEATEARLISMMFGDAIPSTAELPPVVQGKGDQSLLELRKVSTPKKPVGMPLSELDLVIGQGEIVGVAGVSGNGQRELVDLILGLEHCTQGSRIIEGQDATSWTAGRIREAGIGFVPEDPLGMAVVPWMNLVQNTALGNLKRYSRMGGCSIAWQDVQKDLAASFEALSFDSLPAYKPVRTFSGGQLQRAVLAREAGRKPRLLIASYPTQGLDVRTAAAACQVLVQIRNNGGGVLLMSEDLDELYALSDLLMVIHQGRIVGVFKPKEIDRHTIGHLMTGSEVRS